MTFLRKINRFLRSSVDSWDSISEQLEQDEQDLSLRSNFQEAIRTYLSNEKLPKLQIGSGNFPMAGWFNTDIEPSSPEVSFLDATEEFPVSNESFEFIFSEHMIEHITYKDGLNMLQECHRILKPGGQIRIATPDLENFVGLFNDEKNDHQVDYMKWSLRENLGLYSGISSTFQQKKLEWQIDQEHFSTFLPQLENFGACFILNIFMRSYGHLFVYDEKTLSASLKSSGFDQINRCTVGESRSPSFRNLEQHGSRVGDHPNEFETMVLEATKLGR